jgi:shikimate dehydrogenase
MITGKASIAGVIGYPVKHSLSPKLHNYWLEQYGIDGAYIPMEIVPEHLAQAIKALPCLGIKGINVTLPHKEEVLKLMDEVEPLARRIGAVNTVVIKDGKLYGRNTDAYGFIANIKSQRRDFSFHNKTALMLGAGGAARAVCVGLLDAGCSAVLVANRTLVRAEELAKDLGGNVRAIGWGAIPDALSSTDLLVNTTTLGMVGKETLVLDLSPLPTEALVTDIVYTPLMTDLLTHAKARGNPIVTGLGMLLHQAVPGFESWFGKRPEVTDALEHWIRG